MESQKQKIQWLQEQFDLLQQKRFGVSSEKNMTDGDQMSLFNEAEWTVDEADGQIPEPDMAKVAPPKKTKTKGGKLRMVSGLPKETIDFRLSKEEQICPECGEKLTSLEIEMLPMGAKVMTFECGMRFLTDYLEGDHYFKIHRDNHNLDRCRTQFKLVADMEQKWEQMHEIVRKYAK